MLRRRFFISILIVNILAVSCSVSPVDEQMGKQILIALPDETNYPLEKDTLVEILPGLIPDSTDMLHDRIGIPGYLKNAFTLAKIRIPDSLNVNYFFCETEKAITCSYVRTAEFCSYTAGDKASPEACDNAVDKFLESKKEFNRDWYCVTGWIDLLDKSIRIRLVTANSWDTWCVYYLGDTSFTYHEVCRDQPADYPLSTDQSKPLPATVVFQTEWNDRRELLIRAEQIDFPEFNATIFRLAGLVPPRSVYVNLTRAPDGNRLWKQVYPAGCFEEFYVTRGDYNPVVDSSDIFDAPSAFSICSEWESDFGCSAWFDFLSERITITTGEGNWVQRVSYMLAGEGLYQVIECGHRDNDYQVFLNGRLLFYGYAEGELVAYENEFGKR
jgi:hypothetical protein